MDEKVLLTALGPLAPLYQDNEVMEITVDAYDQVSTEHEGKVTDTEVKFESPEAFRAMIDAVLALDGITLDAEHTTADIRLPGRDRFIVTVPPTAVKGPHLVIRKFARSTLISWEFLLKIGAVTQELLDFFKDVLQNEINMLVGGGTSSGKTTFTNRLTELIPDDKRLVVTEYNHEMDIRHPRTIYLEARRVPGMTVTDLLDTARNMLPHWLIINDLHGSEALFAMQLFSSGYTGIGTMHANDPQDALARLEVMCLTANSGMGLNEIRTIISTALQLVVVVNRVKMADGKRRRFVTHVAELQGLENNRYILQPLYRFNPETEVIESTGVKPSWA
ncbi:ATPase, T2SS/T4P/T4SS family [Chloroflexota bacterium]